jgi:ABC-type spermidine/putrescine transport systems, ATPase components
MSESSSNTNTKIEVRNAVKIFGNVKAVNDVSFVVKDGEVVSLLGPSGCGKTTLLRSIAGLEQIDSGEILLDGQIVTSPKKGIFVPAEKRRLGFVFQSYALWPHMTVRQNVRFCLENRKLTREEMNSRTSRSLQVVGLSGLENRYPAELSGGQQQRVALARSLSYEPKVILLDEPLSNLYQKVREKVRVELRVLLKRIGISSIFVTVDQEEAFIISDRTILMNEGRVVQEGIPSTLYSDPANEFVAEFIGHANILPANVVQLVKEKHLAIVKVPELGSELACYYEDESLAKNSSFVVVRYNEIGISLVRPPFSENVFQGQVVFREYRGSVTDHKVKVGNSQLIVSTHRFCNHSNSTDDQDDTHEQDFVFLHIPPRAVKLVPKATRNNDSGLRSTNQK